MRAASAVLHSGAVPLITYVHAAGHGKDRLVTTAIISATAAIIAASITGLVTFFVTIRSKKIELLANSEERKADALNTGYNTMITAADLGWHYRCHDILRQYGIEPPFDWNEEFPNIRNQVKSLFSRGVDLLKANSLHYESVAPALVVLFDIVWKGETVSKMEARPKDYEEARQLLIELSRIDGRLAKPTKRKFWKGFFKKNEPLEMSKLSPEDQLRRAGTMLANKQVDSFLFQGDEAMLAFIKGIQENPPLYTASLVETAGRVEHWKEEKIIKVSMPCDKLDEHCYKEAQAKFPDFETPQED